MRPRDPLSPLEHELMALVWQRGEVTADEVVATLKRPLKNATVRTLLRRLEAKGYVGHTVRGRAFVYHPRVAETRVATGALRRVVQRFFGGSASRLLVGLVDEGLIDRDELKAVSRRLARRGGRTGKPAHE
jgi:BlaI family penicillinase repressor